MTEKPHNSRVILFTGDGKGKTTAALGMALRAAGHGLPTLIVSFIKADATTGVNRAIVGSVIVLTGRGATPGLIALADTATEMRCLKHGYDAGLLAQRGVEY